MQTDGWLSEKSASIYEASTETLFLGRQDAMQRQSLVPLHSFMQGRGRQGQGTTMLEVACGTGRFATFVKVWVLLLLLCAVLMLLQRWQIMCCHCVVKPGDVGRSALSCFASHGHQSG